MIIIAIDLIFLAAIFNGASEAYEADSKIFEKKWKVKEMSWFGSKSWHLKYKDYPKDDSAKFIGSKSFMAWITDFAHFSEGFRNTATSIGFVFVGVHIHDMNKIQGVAIILAFIIGSKLISHLTYNLIR